MITEIRNDDTYAQRKMDALLVREGIRRDDNLDYSCGIFDEDYELIATGSCYRNTIRCTAVSGDHRGEGLLGQIMSHLLTIQAERGNAHVFVYTKPGSAQFFSDIGFYEIVRLEDLVFMENRRDGLRKWISGLENRRCKGTKAAVIMNANPFTLGHRYLAEKASDENGLVHLFVVREEAGPIPFDVRYRLVKEGVSDLKNVICHDSGSYMISSATFPGYFLKDEDAAVRAQAELDIKIFTLIASELGIGCRYVGEEPLSRTTAIYNEIMTKQLPEAGINCIVVPRLQADGEIISASSFRQAVHDGDLEKASVYVPETTMDYFRSAEARMIIENLTAEEDVIHH